MNQREKILLLGLLGVLVVWLVVRPFYNSFVVGAISERREEINRLDAELERREIDETIALKQRAKLRRWTATSLPHNALDAQWLYQEWLSDLVEIVGFENPKIIPMTSTPNRKVFSTVPVEVGGEATFEQVCRFLYLFHRADLLHRIARVDTFESLEGNQGNPLLKVKLVAEGLSLATAKERNRLFHETSLAAPLEADARTLTVTSSAGFPKKDPFRIRIGREYLTVTSAAGAKWTVERGAERTAPGDHPAGAAIEFTPVNRDVAERTPEFYADVANPFVIPGPPIEYQPRLSIPEQTLVRGNDLKLDVKLTGHNPSRGQPVYHLADDAPQGMRINRDTGELVWTPAADQPAASYETRVYATQGDSDTPIAESALRVRFREPNTPPTFAAVAPPRVYLGQPHSLPLQVSDKETPAGRLKFSLGEGAPAGASIDASGVFTWTPAMSVSPGRVEVTVNAVDDGEPPMTGTFKLPLDVQFDNAQFTFLSGVVGINGEHEAWIRDQFKNELTIVRTGETFTVADISAYVLEIGPDFVILLVGEDTWRLPVGDNLRSMVKQPTRPVSAAADEAAGTTPIEAPKPSDSSG